MLKDTELMHMNFGRLQSPLLDLSWKPKVDKNQSETLLRRVVCFPCKDATCLTSL